MTELRNRICRAAYVVPHQAEPPALITFASKRYDHAPSHGQLSEALVPDQDERKWLLNGDDLVRGTVQRLLPGDISLDGLRQAWNGDASLYRALPDDFQSMVFVQLDAEVASGQDWVARRIFFGPFTSFVLGMESVERLIREIDASADVRVEPIPDWHFIVLRQTMLPQRTYDDLITRLD